MNKCTLPTVVFLFIVNGFICPIASAQYLPAYSVDAETLHLYHFDTDGTDAAGTLDLSFGDGAVLAVSKTGFGNAVSTYDGIAGAGPYAGNTGSKTTISELVGADGAFTFEAIVKPIVDQSAIPNNMEIISLEDEASDNGARGFQFRINGVTTQPNCGYLRFQALAGIVVEFDAPISYTADTWYHAAVTYNGLGNTPDNLKLYWTELSNSPTIQEVGSFQISADLQLTIDGYFCVGNELRPSTYTENFEGLIDEVRISSVARMFSGTLPDVDAGDDWISWSGRPVITNATVVNNTADPVLPLTCQWTVDEVSVADSNLKITLIDSDQEDVTVDISKLTPTGDATVVTMTLAANNFESGNPDIIDTMVIEVYDDACKAGLAAGTIIIDQTDLNGDCITNIEDLAELLSEWLDEYVLTEPFVLED